MPEQLKPTTPSQQSHAQTLRENTLRRLSRSPHPYHCLQFELETASERINPASPNAPLITSPLQSTQTMDDEALQLSRRLSHIDKASNSDSGTEEDDEHFLKGLPAPKLRSHKGLGGADSSPSGSPSLVQTPALFDEDDLRLRRPFQRTSSNLSLDQDEARKAEEKFRRRRRIEIVRRSTEAGILCFVSVILCFDAQVRKVLYMWRGGKVCHLACPVYAYYNRTGMLIPHHHVSPCRLSLEVTTAYTAFTAMEEAPTDTDTGECLFALSQRTSANLSIHISRTDPALPHS